MIRYFIINITVIYNTIILTHTKTRVIKMIVPEKTVELKNGKTVVLRSPQLADAAALLDHMKKTSAETHFMVRYPEEIMTSLRDEELFVERINSDDDGFMLAAFLDGKLIACSSILHIGNVSHIKYRHRGAFGISIQAEYCDLGLGSHMLSESIELAEKTSFEQIELGVFSDNLRALHLYEKLGFKKWGVFPRAFKLKDNTYRDEIQMIYELPSGI